uniref:Uncharacterized protein LOC104243782 n=1 Tax=Nicotiana sylvestris TaxID=4096 RepID=A0A1U7Y5U2_NICSY|nr:PREDICTED: uncharacterized protein LOC104243782 [Nicotiana sylvestris]
MDGFEQGKIKDYLKNLVNIMEIEPKRELIEALVYFWDPKNNVFRLNGFEMTPTLEEFAEYTDLGHKSRTKRLLSPRDITATKFLEQMWISHIEIAHVAQGQVHLDFLYDKYGHERGFSKYGKKLINKQNQHIWRGHGRKAFIVAFLGCMVFPREDRKINIRLSRIVTAMMKRNDSYILPMVLADTFRVLTRCWEGKGFFAGCNLLLQMWFMDHLFRRPYQVDHRTCWGNHVRQYNARLKSESEIRNFPESVNDWRKYLHSLTDDQITWNYPWFTAEYVVYKSSCHPFLILMGLRGYQPYVTMRVLR